MPEEKPKIIVVRKKVVGHGHHGGAWKVAYADFVTAMMALFIVLWLMNSNTKVKEAVAGYFRDPAGKGNQAGLEKGFVKTTQASQDNMPKLKEDLEKALKSMPRFDEIKNQIAITLTAEGLRIELMETEKGLFFESGSPKPTDAGLNLLHRLAEELGKLPNRLLIEGHTDARAYVASTTYGNWELSCDRANQARQFMQSSGLRNGQVFQVRGFADQQPRNPAHPEDAANRRISLLVYYQNTPGVDAPAKAQANPEASDAKPSP